MIEYSEDWLINLLFQREGSLAYRSSMYGAASVILTVLLMYLDEYDASARETTGMLALQRSQVWSASTGLMVWLVGFRVNKAYSRFWEGTGLLHQMRGEWFDTVSNLVAFTASAKVADSKKVQIFRHTIVRIMSLCHGCALEEIAGNEIKLATIDTFGLDDETLVHLNECHTQYKFNKVEVMLHFLHAMITKSFDDGTLKIPPPILSRVYQTISRGFVNLLNAKKVCDTRYPFPLAQLIAMLLFVNMLLIPVQMSALVQSKILAGLFTFIPIWGMFSVNFIAGELENPFGTDSNDLPMVQFQGEMNSCLMMLLHPSADHIPGLSERCNFDFDEIINHCCAVATTSGKRLSSFESSADIGEYEQKTTVLSHLSDLGAMFRSSTNSSSQPQHANQNREIGTTLTGGAQNLQPILEAKADKHNDTTAGTVVVCAATSPLEEGGPSPSAAREYVHIAREDGAGGEIDSRRDSGVSSVVAEHCAQLSTSDEIVNQVVARGDAIPTGLSQCHEPIAPDVPNESLSKCHSERFAISIAASLVPRPQDSVQLGT